MSRHLGWRADKQGRGWHFPVHQSFKKKLIPRQKSHTIAYLSTVPPHLCLTNWHFNLFHEIKLELSKLVRDAHYIQRLPCVEGHSHSYVTSPTSAAAVCRGLCLSHSFKVIWGPRGAKDIPLCRKVCKGEEPPDAPAQEKRAKVRSHLTPLLGKVRGGEESPDAPVRILSAFPNFAGLLRQLFTALKNGVQLGRIA